MASESSAAVISALQADLANNRSINACLTLVVYEYLITMEHEWNFLTARRWTAVTWLFMFNRCYNLPFFGFLEAILLLPFVTSGIFSAMRVFALLNRNLLVPGIVLILSLVPLATNGYTLHHSTQVFVSGPITGSTCATVSDSEISLRIFQILSGAARLSVILADVLVLLVTWIKTFRLVKQARSVNVDLSLSETLLRDGSVYFAISLFLSVFLWVSDSEITIYGSEDFAVPAILMDSMQPVLISRFLINLRQSGSSSEGSPGDGPVISVSTVNFRIPTIQDVIGNMGEPLDHAVHERLDGDEASDGYTDTSHDEM